MTCTNPNHHTVALLLAEEFIKRINESTLCPESVLALGTSIVCSAVEKVKDEHIAMKLACVISDFINKKTEQST